MSPGSKKATGPTNATGPPKATDPTKPTGPTAALTSKRLLEHAYAVLDDPPPVLVGRWPRAVALLARQALETTVDDFWRAREVRIGWASERAKLLCLPVALGNRRLAAEASLAWSGLSRAAHQHPYDLSPTAGELAAWLDTVDELRRAVDAHGPRSVGSTV
jgi:hypothetical protein